MLCWLTSLLGAESPLLLPSTGYHLRLQVRRGRHQLNVGTRQGLGFSVAELRPHVTASTELVYRRVGELVLVPLPFRSAAVHATTSLLHDEADGLSPIIGVPLQEHRVRDALLCAVGHLQHEVRVRPQPFSLKGMSSPRLFSSTAFRNSTIRSPRDQDSDSQISTASSWLISGSREHAAINAGAKESMSKEAPSRRWSALGGCLLTSLS